MDTITITTHQKMEVELLLMKEISHLKKSSVALGLQDTSGNRL